jgi:hypothetical protein
MKKIIIKSIKTFIQAFIGALIIGISSCGATNLTELRAAALSVVVAAMSAAVSAIMNIPQIAKIFNHYGELETEPDDSEELPE